MTSYGDSVLLENGGSRVCASGPVMDVVAAVGRMTGGV